MTITRELLQERVGKPHLSYSSLKYAYAGDMEKWAMYMRGDLKKESPALEFGSLYDMMLFEPDKVDLNYWVYSHDSILDQCSDATKKRDRPTTTKEYREVKADMEKEAEQKGLILVPMEEYNKAHAMIERLESCGLSDMYLSSGNYQVEFNEEIDGVGPVKGFIDCLGDGYVVDSKSTRGIKTFKYDVGSFCYDIQAYLYTRVVGTDEFYWLVQEKDVPYYPAIVTCSQATLLAGEMKVNQAIENIKAYLSDDIPRRDYAEFTI